MYHKYMLARWTSIIMLSFALGISFFIMGITFRNTVENAYVLIIASIIYMIITLLSLLIARYHDRSFKRGDE